MMRRMGCSCLVLYLGLALALPARAWDLIPRTLPELAGGAELVFMGRCEAASSHWNKDHTLILTSCRFRVSRVLRGAPQTTVTLEELGGMVGDTGMSVPDVPHYTAGEEVLLFVNRTEIGRLKTFGATQGKFRVVTDARGRQWVRSPFY